MTLELPESGDCIFCAIVSGKAEARWEARPDGGAGGDGSRVVCFHNQLKWARVMLLIVPVRHMTQWELWSSDVLVDAAVLAVEMGDKHCGDDGYRVISNFGRVAHTRARFMPTCTLFRAHRIRPTEPPETREMRPGSM